MVFGVGGLVVFAGIIVRRWGAVNAGGTLVLTDWKTGRDDDEYETELQMKAYVLWAMQYYRMRADDIRTELIFLKTGKVKPYSFFCEQLFELQEMIPKEFAEMNASYEYGDFPARPSQRECLSCKFAEVCPEAGIFKANV